MRPDLTLRRPTEEDAPAISAVCNSLTRELYGEGDVDEAEVRSWFSLPELEVQVAERGERIVGYMDVRRDDDGTRFPIDLRIPPGGRGNGAAERLIAAAEAWARPRAKPGAVVRGYTPERDHETASAFVRSGYRLIRHSFFMETDLAPTLEPPAWPEGIALRTYDPARDEQAVYDCSNEAFADHWDFRPTPIDQWRRFAFHRADFDPTLWWLAEAGDELAGVCLNGWHFSGDRTFGWIGTLGVRRPWRRRGLALALLRHSFADFARRGASRVGLGVDAENTTGAVRLYERAGMRPVRRNDTYEKALDGA